MIKEDLKKQFDVLSAEVSAQDPRQIKSNNKNVQELYQLASNYKQVTGGELPYNPNEKHLWDTAFASIDKKIAEYNKETEQREKAIKTAEQEIEKTIAKIGAEEGIIKDLVEAGSSLTKALAKYPTTFLTKLLTCLTTPLAHFLRVLNMVSYSFLIIFCIHYYYPP